MIFYGIKLNNKMKSKNVGGLHKIQNFHLKEFKFYRHDTNVSRHYVKG